MQTHLLHNELHQEALAVASDLPPDPAAEAAAVLVVATATRKDLWPTTKCKVKINEVKILNNKCKQVTFQQEGKTKDNSLLKA